MTISDYIQTNATKDQAKRTPIKRLIVLDDIQTVIIDNYKYATCELMGIVLDKMLTIYKRRGDYQVFQTFHVE